MKYWMKVHLIKNVYFIAVNLNAQVIIVAEFVLIRDIKNKILIGLHQYLVSCRKCSRTVLLRKFLYKIFITFFYKIIILHNTVYKIISRNF